MGLGGLIWIGSRRLAHFDAALAAYTAAILFAAFGLTYRYAVWLQRPPTAMFWRRGWEVFLRRGRLGRNAADWVRFVSSDPAANRENPEHRAHVAAVWGVDPETLPQLWLFTASMNAFLGSDTGVLGPAAVASVLCLGLNLGLLRYLYGLER